MAATGAELLAALQQILASDTEFDELGLTLGEPSPRAEDAFLVHETKLGVAFWSIPLLFEHVSERFRVETDPSEQLQLTTVGLLINADNYTMLGRRCGWLGAPRF